MTTESQAPSEPQAADSKPPAKRPRVLHPPLLALYPVLGLYAHNIEKTPVTTLMRPAAVTVIAALVIWGVCWGLARNSYKGGIIASALILGALSGWSVLENTIAIAAPIAAQWSNVVHYIIYAAITVAVGAALYQWGSPKLRSWPAFLALAVLAVLIAAAVEGIMAPAFGRAASWCIALYLVALTGVVVYLSRRRGGFILMTRTANWFAAILITLSLANIAFNWPGGAEVSAPPPPDLEQAIANAENKPDIYLIVLEGYARHDLLREAYAYNNLPFLETMRNHGLAAANQSVANYAEPVMSLASLLNMDYAHALSAGGAADDPDGLGPAVELYHNNRVFTALRRAGYEIIVFPPGLAMLEPRLNVETHRPGDILNEFEMVLAAHTVAARILQGWNYVIHRDNLNLREVVERRRVLHVFDGLAELAATASEQPRLIYAYMSIPGPPFLFNRDGGRAERSTVVTSDSRDVFRGSWTDYVQAYVDQLTFTNRRLERAIDSIMEAGEGDPPVILIASSQGIGVLREEFRQVPPELLLSNLTLMGIPGRDQQRLMNRPVSPVNLFRIVFNEVFEADLSLLDNEIVGITDPADVPVLDHEVSAQDSR